MVNRKQVENELNRNEGRSSGDKGDSRDFTGIDPITQG